MILCGIILGISGLALVIIGYQSAKKVIELDFRKQNENLSDVELKRVAQDLFDTLDDHGWAWHTVILYHAALKMLQERKASNNKKGPA